MPVGILFFVMKINKEDVHIDVLGEAEAASAERRRPRSPNTAYSNLYQLPHVSFGIYRYRYWKDKYVTAQNYFYGFLAAPFLSEDRRSSLG